MEDIKSYLEQANTEHWEYLRNNPPKFLDEVGEEITTEKMGKILLKSMIENAEAIRKLDEQLEEMNNRLDKAYSVLEGFFNIK